MKVDIHWIRGHANIGGNERVDKISKFFAKANGPNPPTFHLSSSPPYQAISSDWPFGHPLFNLPSHFCTSCPVFSIPVFPAPPTIVHEVEAPVAYSKRRKLPDSGIPIGDASSPLSLRRSKRP